MTGINLLPPELKEERKKAQINFRAVAICFSVIFVFILGLIGLEAANQILALSLKTSQEQIEWQEKEIEKLKDIDQKAKQVSEILALLDNLEKNRIDWPGILKDGAASCPSALQITTLTVNSKTSPNFNISGLTTSYREIAKFKEKLEKSSYFKNVMFISFSQGQNEKGSFVNFSLQADSENKR